MRCIVFTLTFDSSPIKGEGDMVGLSCVAPPPPLWIADQVRNDGPGWCGFVHSRARRPVDTALKPV